MNRRIARTVAFAFATVLTIQIVGCSETPENVLSTGNQVLDDHAFGLSNLGVDTAELDGIDLVSLTGSIDLNSAVEALNGPPPDLAVNSKRTRVVKPGESIQEAVDQAPSGATIWIRPGTYEGPVMICKSLRLVGWPGRRSAKVVIVPPPGGAADGIYVMPDEGHGEEHVEDVLLANLTVQGFTDNGVYAENTDGLLMLNMVAVDNGEYGLYPVLSRNGIIAHSAATGSADAGIYVGQSENYVIQNNSAYGNVIGIEIENSVRVAAVRNRAYENTAGLLAVLLPPDPEGHGHITFFEASDVRIAHNAFENNNLANFAEPGGFAAAVPAGSGLLSIGFDRTRIEYNRIRNNDFVGVGVGSTATFLLLLGTPPEQIAQIPINLDPDEVEVRHNVLQGNATLEASPLPPLPGGASLPPVDLLWDTTGSDNCWSKNVFESSFPEALPSCGAGT